MDNEETIVSIFVSHNNKLNCMLKTLITGEINPTPHFINGAVIKISFPKGVEEGTIELLNSHYNDVEDELKNNKVEHMKNNGKIWINRDGVTRAGRYKPKDGKKGKTGWGFVEGWTEDGVERNDKEVDIIFKPFYTDKVIKRQDYGLKDNGKEYIMYFVRHGEGIHNIFEPSIKHPLTTAQQLVIMKDPPLTAKGICDGLYAATTIFKDLKEKRKKIDVRFFVSDLKRSQETNDIIYRFLKYQCLFDNKKYLYEVPCLHEIKKDKCIGDPPLKISSTPNRDYDPKYWPNENHKNFDGKTDIDYIKEILISEGSNQRYMNKIIGTDLDSYREFIKAFLRKSSKSLEEKEVTPIELYCNKPIDINRWEYYPNVDNTAYEKDADNTKKWCAEQGLQEDHEMKDILETLDKLKHRDYGQEQHNRDLFQTKAHKATAVIGAVTAIPAAPVALVGKKAHKKLKSKSSSGGAAEVATAAAVGTAVSAAANVPVAFSAGITKKFFNKDSYCKVINPDNVLSSLIKIGLTWNNWNIPFSGVNNDLETFLEENIEFANNIATGGSGDEIWKVKLKGDDKSRILKIFVKDNDYYKKPDELMYHEALNDDNILREFIPKIEKTPDNIDIMGLCRIKVENGKIKINNESNKKQDRKWILLMEDIVFNQVGETDDERGRMELLGFTQNNLDTPEGKELLKNLYYQLLLLIIKMNFEGFQHCDLHPGNVMVVKNPDKTKNKILEVKDYDYSKNFTKDSIESIDNNIEYHGEFYSLKIIDFGEMKDSDEYCKHRRRRLSQKVLELCNDSMGLKIKNSKKLGADNISKIPGLNLSEERYMMDFIFFFEMVLLLDDCLNILELNEIQKNQLKGKIKGWVDNFQNKENIINERLIKDIHDFFYAFTPTGKQKWDDAAADSTSSSGIVGNPLVDDGFIGGTSKHKTNKKHRTNKKGKRTNKKKRIKRKRTNKRI